PALGIGALALAVGLFVPFVIVVLVTIGLTSSFVVPIMYRHDLSATAAWSRLLGLMGENVPSFGLFLLFVFGLLVLVGLGIVAVGLLTCCVGFLLLILPYVGSVLLLPVTLTLRALSLEFLAQFGPEWSVFPQAPPVVPAAPPPPPPPPSPPAPPAPPAPPPISPGA